ncbi:MAG TPA: carboxypeptidase regulatory-like domain-containing protein [Pyrinomonadaceae bacterium]|nr:carboxypeptidase regulatory-like domain-containing protein [Pyrinomonadaceae bacterium]
MVDLTVNANDPDNDTFLYTWSVTAGRLIGDGRGVTWDLSTVNAGTYTAIVQVNDLNGFTVKSATTISVMECSGCRPPCPTFSVTPSDVGEGQPLTFSASISNTSTITYNWSVSAGTITAGQGTSSITVDITGIGGQSVTATLEVGGLDSSCSRIASASISVKSIPETAIITGVVKDIDGQFLSGVRITAISDHFSAEGVTEPNGRYVLRPMAIGTYRVTATLPSFSRGTATVALPRPGDMGEANFQLTRPAKRQKRPRRQRL